MVKKYKLLNILLMQSCNLNCYYCTMKKWLYPLGFEFPHNFSERPDPTWHKDEQERNVKSINAIRTEPLLKWLDEHCPSDDWVLQITGGEPSLYYDLPNLIKELETRDYYGTIQTNGILPVPASTNFVRVISWHIDVKELPKYYDYVQIIRNPKDNWREKIQFCKDNNIKCYPVSFNRAYAGNPFPYSAFISSPPSFLDGLTTMYSMGQITGCASNGDAPEGSSIYNDSKTIIHSLEPEACQHCGFIHGFEYYMREHFPDKFGAFSAEESARVHKGECV